MPRRTPKQEPGGLEKESTPTSGDPMTLPAPALNSQSLRMSYRIARGEQGVLTFEPYKSFLLPFWRFKTVPIAKNSSVQLKKAFDQYVAAGDLVGADMARKFIQMGMTRAKRYANHKGGRKYERTGVGEDGKGKELPKSEAHKGREEKLEASEVFKAVWRECVADERYLRIKSEFLKERKEWDKNVKEEETPIGKVKEEDIE